LPADDHVARRLGELRIDDLGKKALLGLGEVNAIDMIDQIGGAKIGELGIGKFGSNVGERKRLPAA
jgi:hypothetical protein